MKTLILMQGVPGSGKSHVVKGISGGSGFAKAAVFSTDDFWYDQDGEYKFDPSLLGLAHKTNQVKAEAAMRHGIQTIIVDNTNIKRDHVQPYVIAAAIYGYDVQVIRVSVDPGVACARQLNRPEGRRVPEETILRMHREMENLV